MVTHEMTSRLAVRDQPLMALLRERLGQTVAVPTAVALSVFMSLWATANLAVFAVAIRELTGIGIPVTILAIGGALISITLIGLHRYRDVEIVICVLLSGFILAFLTVFLGDVPSAGAVADGFIPALGDQGYLTMVIAFLGTTVYYPNLWIQTSMGQEKGWDLEDLPVLRKENLTGLLTAVLASTLVMIVMAHQVPSSSSISFLDPIRSLQSLGGLGTPVFLLGTIMASFTSATGTLFAAGFILPQARGQEVAFGDQTFQEGLAGTLAFGTALIPVTLASTSLGPVDMAILFPAVNGIIGLPLTAGLTIYFLNQQTEPSRTMNVAAIAVFILLLMISGLTAQSLLRSLTQGIA